MVELLVLVAIIAVLASMLLPALGKAREQAARSVCLSGLRQCHIALQMYAEDHGDCMPSYKHESGDVSWCDYTREMVTLRYLTLRGDKPLPTSTAQSTAEIAICPTAERQAEFDTTLLYRVRRYGAYCYNGYMVDPDHAPGRFGIPVQLRWVHCPADCILLQDGNLGTNWAGVGSVSLLHGAFHPLGTMAVVFFDGHTASLNRGQVPVTSNVRLYTGR